MDFFRVADEGVSRMSLAIINSTSKALLKDAKAASLRRGSKVIREVDVTYAISRFKMVDSHKWYLIPVAGNGDCQFTSIRLCMELSYIIKKIEAGDPPEEIVLDGHDRDMLKAAHTTRLKIVEWYRKRLNHPVPQLGNYIEGPNARPWVRGDLLAAEMVRNGKDVPESGPERENVILRYLLNMSERSTWGSTPEYFAAACMTGKKIHVRQMNEKGELFIINSVNGSSIPPPVIIGNQVEPPKLLPPQQPPKLPPPLQNETEFSPEVVSTAIVLSPELCDSSFHDSSSAACSLSSASSQVKLFSTKALNDSEMDAELYGETDAMGGETECEESDDSKSEVGDYGSDNDSDDGEECKESDDDDGSYNLFFSNNHYQALVTHSQYLRLVAQYGIDAFRNFRGI